MKLTAKANSAKAKLAALALAAFAITTPASAAQEFDLSTPQNFCFLVERYAGNVMQKLNDGYPLNSVYRDLNAVGNGKLKFYFNYVATVAEQFPRDADPDMFAQWQHTQCLAELKLRPGFLRGN